MILTTEMPQCSQRLWSAERPRAPRTSTALFRTLITEEERGTRGSLFEKDPQKPGMSRRGHHVLSTMVKVGEPLLGRKR